jgi:hypothetical protein
MPNAHRAELAAIAMSISEAGSRVAAIAALYDDDRHQGLVAALHGAERNLRHAARDLDRCRQLDG